MTPGPAGGASGAGGGAFGLRELLLASRPVSWINTGLPFLAAAFDETRALTPLVVLGTLYFLVPYNLLLYGVNDLFDYASDVANPRKRSLEGGLVAPSHGRRLWTAILATNAPLLALLAWLAGTAVAAAALLATVAVAVAYSAPPLRTKVRPFLDSFTSALHFVLPAACGFLLAGRDPADLPWLLLAGFIAWGVASHAIGAIQDVGYDRAAGIGSIATAIGGRATAVVALAGYGFAVAAALALPAPWGPLVALVLSPYLLLPAMVLARDDEPQARRAWRSFMGLNIPVGFVLAQALLRHWGVTTYDAWGLATWVATGAVCVVLANVGLTRWATRRRAARTSGRAPDAAVTVIVPCRDEADRLPDALGALVAARYPGELRVLVADDGSADGSAAVAAHVLAPLGDRARVLVLPPAPDGWQGKSWAVSSAMAEVSTDLALVVDADTVLAPDTIAVLVAELDAAGADLCSGVTRYAMPTLAEQAAMPGYPLLLFGFVPVWLGALRGGRPPSVAFAYGPLQLFRAAAWRATRGHAAVPGSHREDVDLARTFSRAGRRVHTTHAADLGATRHYRTAREALAAWARILPGYTGGSLALALVTLAGEALAYLLPLLLPLLAAIVAPDRLGAALVPLVLLAAARLALAATQRQPLATVLLHPVTIGLTLAAQAAGVAGMVAGRTPGWRGRALPEAPPGSGRPTAPGPSAAAEPANSPRQASPTHGSRDPIA